MAYKLFDKEGNQINLGDLQAKGPWCEKGAKSEVVFVKKYGDRFSLGINPEKIYNKYAADLINVSSKVLGDLKTKNTPFFLARKKFGYDPQYTVTFDLKDYDNYSTKYKSFEVYFWVLWIAVKYQNIYNGRITETIIVEPMEGIWKIELADLASLVSTAPIHTYRQRIGDKLGNSQHAYVLNLESKEFKKIF